MSMYTKHYSTRVTPQTEKIPGQDQIKNAAGGYVYAITDWQRLIRFLILGSSESTYYSSSKKLTIDNADAVVRCIKEDGPRVVKEILAVSTTGRAPKNDPAIFVLALCAGHPDANPETRKAALEALPKICRIGTHLFQFLDSVKAFRGFGRSLKRATQQWYLEKPLDSLVYQMIKYKNREGWTHRDVLRLAHPKPNLLQEKVFGYFVTKEDAKRFIEDLKKINEVAQAKEEKPVVEDGSREAKGISQLAAADEIKNFEPNRETTKRLIQLVTQERLPREVIPTQFLNDKEVWKALLTDMPMTALIRNLGKLTSIEVLRYGTKELDSVVSQLTNAEHIKASKVHPMTILMALKQYALGKGDKGSLTWKPETRIVEALDDAFYLAFGNVEPTGKRICQAVDVSGSMTWEMKNLPGFTPHTVVGAMAMITTRVEKNAKVVAFTTELSEVTISPRQRLDDIIGSWSNCDFGGTDCAQPLTWALSKGYEFDTFIIYTDNESYAGPIHVSQAIKQYREKTGIPAKVIVCSVTATGTSILPSGDSGCLETCGWDSNVPQIISEFIKGF